MESHWVPRHIRVDQHSAALLKVDAFAAGLGGHKKPHLPRIEGIRGVLARLADSLCRA
jgi:hypothetical protein